MNKYKVLILQRGGNYSEEEYTAMTAEMTVRGIMCWYSTGTRFIVTAEDGRTEKFINVQSADKIGGYTDLQRIA